MRAFVCVLSIGIAGCGFTRDLDQYGSGTAGAAGSVGTGGADAGGGAAAGSGGVGGHSSGGAGGASSGGVAGTSTGGASATGGASGTGGGSTGGTGGTNGNACGNGKLDFGEECDDGGKADGDGCSATCQVACADLFGGGDEFTSAGRVHCYRFEGDQATWEEAASKCAGVKNAHLVTIQNSPENEFVKSLPTGSVQRFWIGLSDGQSVNSNSDIAYEWITKEAVTFTSWASGEPNHANVACLGIAHCYEHRVAMQAAGTWGDRLATEKNAFVCEWEPPPNG
jgi:cysteine-rich repeat protein